MQNPKLLFIATCFCEYYRNIYGKEYWLAKKWTRGIPNERMDSEFTEVSEFFMQRGLVGPVQHHLMRGYIRFALIHFHTENKKPSPKFLVDNALLTKYYLTPQPLPDCELEDVDYRRILSPELRELFSPESLQH